MQPSYGSKVKLLYGHIQLFFVRQRFLQRHCKIVEVSFDKSRYLKNDNKPLPTRKNKKVIHMMKDELGGKVTVEFVA